MRAVAGAGAGGVFNGMRERTGAEGAGDGIDFAEEPAGAEGERVLLFFVRRLVRGGGSGGMVHVAVDVSDFVYGSLRGGAVYVGILVRESSTGVPPVSSCSHGRDSRATIWL